MSALLGRSMSRWSTGYESVRPFLGREVAFRTFSNFAQLTTGRSSAHFLPSGLQFWSEVVLYCRRDAERHKRFVKMVREVGASEDPRGFDKAFKRVTESPPSPKNRQGT